MPKVEVEISELPAWEAFVIGRLTKKGPFPRKFLKNRLKQILDRTQFGRDDERVEAKEGIAFFQSLLKEVKNAKSPDKSAKSAFAAGLMFAYLTNALTCQRMDEVTARG